MSFFVTSLVFGLVFFSYAPLFILGIYPENYLTEVGFDLEDGHKNWKLVKDGLVVDENSYLANIYIDELKGLPEGDSKILGARLWTINYNKNSDFEALSMSGYDDNIENNIKLMKNFYTIGIAFTNGNDYGVVSDYMEYLSKFWHWEKTEIEDMQFAVYGQSCDYTQNYTCHGPVYLLKRMLYIGYFIAENLVKENFDLENSQKNWNFVHDNPNLEGESIEAQQYINELWSHEKYNSKILGARLWTIEKNKDKDLDELRNYGFGDDIQKNLRIMKIYFNFAVESYEQKDFDVVHKYLYFLSNWLKTSKKELSAVGITLTDQPYGITKWVNSQYSAIEEFCEE